MKKFPPEFIEQLRSSVDIVEYIGQFVQLKKRGKNFIGLCPFHSEKTPSFSVSAEKQMYYCFGCGKGGSIYKFLDEFEKLTFPEAVQRLAERAGIPLPKIHNDEQEISETEELYEILRRTAKHFHDQLVHSNEGEFALEYLHKRKFSSDTIRKFGLGYAPRNWEFLVGKFREENISLEFAEKVGVIKKRDDGSYYDTFRGRVTFPIFNTMGKVVGFGARKLYDDDNLGKYINSSETPVYNKSKILYGLNFSKDAIREKENAILVEGYADYLSLFQTGIENVIASSGTALTEEQIQLLSRFTRTVTILYDADTAGSNAALRGVDLVLAKSLDVRIVQLPEGEDPDTFVQKFGKEEAEKRISNAISFIDFIADSFLSRGKFSTPEGMTEAVRSIVQSIAKIPDEIKREFFIKRVSEKYAIRESTLLLELEKQLPKNYSSQKQFTSVQQKTFSSNNLPLQEPAFRLTAAEKDILRVIVEGERELINYIFNNVVYEHLQPQMQTVYHLLMEQFENSQTIEVTELLDSLSDGTTKKIIGEVVFERNDISKRWEEMGKEIQQADLRHLAFVAVIALRKQSLQREYEQLQNILKFGKGTEIVKAMKQMREIQLQIKQLDEQLSGK